MSSSKRFMYIGLGIVIVAVVVIIAVASKQKSHTMTMSSPSPSASTSVNQSTNAVTISNFAFGPSAVTVKTGTTVTWTNQDSVQHTVTGDNGGPASQLFGRGQTYSYTFTKAGTYAYHCTPHSYMKGTVVVTD